MLPAAVTVTVSPVAVSPEASTTFPELLVAITTSPAPCAVIAVAIVRFAPAGAVLVNVMLFCPSTTPPLAEMFA
jgi:hypothetical protein